MAYFTGQINTNVDSGIAIAGGKIDNLTQRLHHQQKLYGKAVVYIVHIHQVDKH